MSSDVTLLDDLVALLALEPIEENLFRGQSVDLGWGTVFGGQVLGQALSAAVRTVPADRHVHSLHAYFLRTGDVGRPVIYDVDRIRDGGSFTTRRVVAIQKGRPIFNLAASFQVEEEGFAHHTPMPDVAPPEQLAPDSERYAELADRLPPFLQGMAHAKSPFEHRTVDPVDDPFQPTPMPARRRVWMRTRCALPDDPALHRYLLAYISDHGFLVTGLRPHGATWLTPGIRMASLDHAMWFHAPFRMDDWLLYDVDGPVASGGRALVRGLIYDRAGRLVASAAQEGLVRQRRKPPTAG